MRILFVHQGFPGQYRHILRALSAQGDHVLVGMGISALREPIPKGVSYIRYALTRGSSKEIHPLVVETEAKVIRGEACARAALQLKQKGFHPDLICAHPGWGEALFLNDIWPDVPILSYQEFYYQAKGFDSDFDKEFQLNTKWIDSAKLRMKNANPLLMLEQSTWNITPTFFQRTTFPSEYQSKISVIHDGIDIELASPVDKPEPITILNKHLIEYNDNVITFVNRSIEPYRGCHVFIRAIPLIQKLCPGVKIVIVGGWEDVSYGAKPKEGNWKDKFLAEIEGSYDSSRVYFTGNLTYLNFIKLLKLSSCHVYLTYPFVLSWSLLEAMSISIPVVASDTAPVKEVISHNENGLLVDFFSVDQLAESIYEILNDSNLANKLGKASRETILNSYSIDKCVPRQIQLMELVAEGVIK